MVLTLLLLTAARQLGPIEFGGVPGLKNAEMPIHQVTFTIKDDKATIQTDSRLTVATDSTVTLDIPVYRQGDFEATPELPIATIDGAPISLRLPLGLKNDGQPVLVTGNALLKAGNHSLRIRYQSVAARTGLGHKQRAFAYSMGNGPEIGRLEFIYHYDQDTVFNVPDMEPADWKWQTGKTGTYLRLDHFRPNREVVFFTYYSAKVEDQQ